MQLCSERKLENDPENMVRSDFGKLKCVVNYRLRKEIAVDTAWLAKRAFDSAVRSEPIELEKQPKEIVVHRSKQVNCLAIWKRIEHRRPKFRRVLATSLADDVVYF